jgi:hypothetical protein
MELLVGLLALTILLVVAPRLVAVASVIIGVTVLFVLGNALFLVLRGGS